MRKHKDEFSEAEYAAIGRVVRSFTVLEDDLARAMVCLLYPSAGQDVQQFDQYAEATLTAGLEGRINTFKRAYIKVNGPDDWIENFTEILRLSAEWRNAICHGRWSRASCGAMRLIFFQRDYVKKRIDPPDHCLQIDDLLRMERENMRAAFHLADNFIRPLDYTE